MATVFDEYIQGQYSILHTAVFYIRDVEYELSLQSITKHNTYDSSIAFPKNYSFSAQSCWDFSFDIAENLRKRTYFARAPRGAVNAFSVLRKVESIIFDH
ncbi:hypothetical protein [Rosenbergiella nectarea]|uniref:hypothetical protein n=1 Tax=Rosenbergiella nectarea TaxID=988801 RepID=UPI001F4D943C|nr:hypothetical protein [Rosenbergiella nectarea]